MTRATDIEQVDVWRDGQRVGTLERTTTGSVFSYDADFFARHRDEPGGIAVHLPYGRERTETRGVNLHPFFAGMLPEGLRLRALVERIKTSEDDLFSLLVAAGGDTVGDVFVVPVGQPVELEATPPRGWKPEEVSFAELFEESLAHTGSGSAEPLVPGVQEKVSASRITFPVAGRRGDASLLKLNPADKPRLVENEAFFMRMARSCGIEVADTKLVSDRSGASGLLVRRFDRVRMGERLERIHLEDACQFLNRYPADKYRIPCSEIAEGIAELAAAPIPEVTKFLRLVAFSYVIGNGDLHAKNVSLLASGVGGGLLLSPAYDLLSTLPYGDTKMALRFEGRDDNLKRAHFLAFGSRYGAPPAAVERMLDALCKKAAPWLDRLQEIGLDQRKTAHLRQTMEKRLADLTA